MKRSLRLIVEIIKNCGVGYLGRVTIRELWQVGYWHLTCKMLNTHIDLAQNI